MYDLVFFNWSINLLAIFSNGMVQKNTNLLLEIVHAVYAPGKSVDLITLLLKYIKN